MRRMVHVLVILCTAAAVVPAAAGAGDEAGVREAVLNYIEGWYEGDPARMEAALHPELTKRGVLPLEATGGTILNTATQSLMVEYTRAGFGKLPPEERGIDVKTVVIYRDIAMVRVDSAKFIDLVHLARLDGEWKIVNVLWQPVPAE